MHIAYTIAVLLVISVVLFHLETGKFPMKCIYNCSTCSNFCSSFPSLNRKISNEMHIHMQNCTYSTHVTMNTLLIHMDYGKLIEIQMLRFCKSYLILVHHSVSREYPPKEKRKSIGWRCWL